MTAEFISEIANLALTLSLIVAIIFGLVQINAAKKDRREQLTLETLRTFHSREFAELILFITTTKFPNSYDEWPTWPKEDKETFIQLTQQMESLGILLADGLINFELLDKTLGSFVVTTWEKLKPLIVDMRERLPDPYLSEYFQWMAEQIDDKLKNNKREPYYKVKRVR